MTKINNIYYSKKNEKSTLRDPPDVTSGIPCTNGQWANAKK